MLFLSSKIFASVFFGLFSRSGPRALAFITLLLLVMPPPGAGAAATGDLYYARQFNLQGDTWQELDRFTGALSIGGTQQHLFEANGNDILFTAQEQMSLGGTAAKPASEIIFRTSGNTIDFQAPGALLFTETAMSGTPTLTFDQQSGQLDATIANADMTRSNGIIKLREAVAGDLDVRIKNFVVGDGNTLTIVRTGTADFTHTGDIILRDGGGALDFGSKTLIFTGMQRLVLDLASETFASNSAAAPLLKFAPNTTLGLDPAGNISLTSASSARVADALRAKFANSELGNGINLANNVTFTGSDPNPVAFSVSAGHTAGVAGDSATIGYRYGLAGGNLWIYAADVRGANVTYDSTAPSAFAATYGPISQTVTGVYTVDGPANLVYRGVGASNTAELIAGTVAFTGGGSLAFEKSPAGAAARAYIGTLDASGGNAAVRLDGTSASDVNISNVTLGGGHTFTVTSANSGAGTFTTLNVTGAGGTLAGNHAPDFANVNLAGGSNLTVDQTGDQTLSGPISGTGNLIKSGAGSLTLSGANAYTGNTVVRGGVLALAGAGSLGGSSSMFLSGGAGFDFSGLNAASLSLPRLDVSGNGAWIEAGTGTLAVTNGLNFFIPATAVSGASLLTVRGNADITGAAVGLACQAARPAIQSGQSLTLLSAASLAADQTGLTVRTPDGDVYSLLVDNNRLLAVLDYISPTTPAYERLKAYAEGRAASLAFVGQGADLLLGQGFGSALAATSGPGLRAGTFGAGAGGWSRYNTGSHVDVSGASMLAGLAVGNDFGGGRGTLGAFFEGGWGSYNSYNSFSNYASVDGDGDTSYYGGGVISRFDVKDGALGGAHVEASARLGRAGTDFSSDDIRYNGNKADFDSESMYWGAHAGLGYKLDLTDKAELDLSGKFVWTRQEGDSVSVRGDKASFKDADSLRTRLGGRVAYAVREYVSPYAGAYWEHEFDGRQRGSVNGVDIGSPSLKGDTGVGELGISVRPVKDSGFSLDLGAQGYTGVREGVGGSLQLKWEF